MEWGGATIEAECAYHSNQAENVISMKVGNEYSIYLCKVETRFPYLLLSALTTVNHKEFAPYLHDL